MDSQDEMRDDAPEANPIKDSLKNVIRSSISGYYIQYNG